MQNLFDWLSCLLSRYTQLASTLTAVLTEICSCEIYGWTCSFWCWRLLVGETLNDLLEYAGTWQLVGCLCLILIHLSFFHCYSFLNSLLFFSLFTSHDAGWLAGLHCHYVADLVPGTTTKSKCTDVWLMWACIMNKKLHTATLPLHLACFAKITVLALIVKVLPAMGSKTEKEAKLSFPRTSFTCWCLLLLAFTKSRYVVHWPLWMCQNCQGVTHINRWSLTAPSSFCLLLPVRITNSWPFLLTDRFACDEMVVTVDYWPVLTNILFNKWIETSTNSYFCLMLCMWNGTGKTKVIVVCLSRQGVFLCPQLPLYRAIMPSMFLWSLLYRSSIFRCSPIFCLLSSLTPSLCHHLEVLVIARSPGRVYFLWKQLIFTGLNNTHLLAGLFYFTTFYFFNFPNWKSLLHPLYIVLCLVCHHRYQSKSVAFYADRALYLLLQHLYIRWQRELVGLQLKKTHASVHASASRFRKQQHTT